MKFKFVVYAFAISCLYLNTLIASNQVLDMEKEAHGPYSSGAISLDPALETQERAVHAYLSKGYHLQFSRYLDEQETAKELINILFCYASKKLKDDLLDSYHVKKNELELSEASNAVKMVALLRELEYEVFYSRKYCRNSTLQEATQNHILPLINRYMYLYDQESILESQPL